MFLDCEINQETTSEWYYDSDVRHRKSLCQNIKLSHFFQQLNLTSHFKLNYINDWILGYRDILEEVIEFLNKHESLAHSSLITMMKTILTAEYYRQFGNLKVYVHPLQIIKLRRISFEILIETWRTILQTALIKSHDLFNARIAANPKEKNPCNYF